MIICNKLVTDNYTGIGTNYVLISGLNWTATVNKANTLKYPVMLKKQQQIIENDNVARSMYSICASYILLVLLAAIF